MLNKVLKRRAWDVFKAQRDRCRNPKNKAFKTYGAKGISVEYCFSDFLTWYEVAIEKNKHLSRPSVGRINHDKNYSFENIEMIELSENAREMTVRCGPPTDRVPIRVLRDGIVVGSFPSIRSAASFFRICHKGICNVLNGKSKTFHGFTYVRIS